MSTPLTTIVFPIQAEIVADATNPQREIAELEQYESLLRKTGNPAWESAAAISEIIDRNLYRLVGFDRFGDYCQERLGVGRQWAYKLRKAHTIMQIANGQSLESDDEPSENLTVVDGEIRVASERHENTPSNHGENGTESEKALSMPASAATMLTGLSPDQAVAVVARLAEQSAAEGVPISSAMAKAAVKAEKAAAKAAAAAAAAPPAPMPEPLAEPEPPKPATPRMLAEQAIANGVAGKEVLKLVRIAMKALRDMPDISGLDMLTARKESVARHLENAVSAITAYLPAIVCPKCNGRKCPDCGNHGWLNKAAKRELNNPSQ